MADQQKQFKAGDRLRVVLSNEDDPEPLYSAEYLLEEPDTPVMVNQAWKTPVLKAFHSAEQPAPGAGGSQGLEVAKFAWDVIKDNKPVARATGAMTSVLASGTSGLDYTGAKDAQTPNCIFQVNDWPTGWNLITVKFRLEGTYAATPAKPSIPRGHYLPSIYFNVTSCSTVWPMWVEAVAEVLPPSDFGTPADRQPQVKLYAKLSWGWIASAGINSFGFVANGARGLSAQGWEQYT